MQFTQGPQDDDLRLHVELFLRSKAVDCDFLEFAGHLLPTYIGRGCVAIFGAVLEILRTDLEVSMYRGALRF